MMNIEAVRYCDLKRKLILPNYHKIIDFSDKYYQIAVDQSPFRDVQMQE